MLAEINVSLPVGLLHRLDLGARESHATRSAFLVQAVEHYLAEKEEEGKQRRRRDAAERMLKLADELGPWDGTAAALKWRDRH